MTEQESAVVQLLMKYPDARRHPLVTGCKDWEEIPPALQELITTSVTVNDRDSAFEWINDLRCVIETIYVMGYERGSRSKSLAFTVAEEQAE